MQHPRPMDRLICGDEGFGKTEVAIRAAFRVAAAGRQAAVLVPTTVLAEQHERTFRNRFAGFPFRVESMSRFKTAVENMPEVLDFYRMAGDIDYLLRVVVPTMDAFNEFYKRLIGRIPFSNVTSSFAMERIKYTTALPISAN